MHKKNSQSGFTLLELLVIMAIIGILTTITLVVLNSARDKAHDAKMRAEINQMAKALELYKSNYGTYRVSGSGYLGTSTGWANYQDGSSYTTAVTQKLFSLGYLGKMELETTPNLMMYLCNSDDYYSLSATLMYPLPSEIQQAATVCNGPTITGTYGKNFAFGN